MILQTRLIALLLLASVLGCPLSAYSASLANGPDLSGAGTDKAAKKKPRISQFNPVDFVAAARSGGRFVVITTRDGHPVCIRQEPALMVLLQESDYRDYRIFRLNVDTQPEMAATMHATDPCLIMVYHGGKEVSRTIGVVDPEGLAGLLSASPPAPAPAAP